MDQFFSGEFFTTSINCLQIISNWLLYEFLSSPLSQDKILTTHFSQSVLLLLYYRPEVFQMILFTLINFAYWSYHNAVCHI